MSMGDQYSSMPFSVTDQGNLEITDTSTVIENLSAEEDPLVPESGGRATTSRAIQTDVRDPSEYTSEQSLETKARVELATKQYEDLKEIFSGALNDKQLLCGILLILCFYVFCSIFNIAIIGNDEENDNEACQCTLSQRRCLQITITGFCLTWIVCFAVIITYDSYKLCRS